MPGSQQILAGLTALAHRALPVAAGWHLALLAAVLAWLAGVRPSRRLTGGLLALPMLSVGLLAFAMGNAFNGAVFVALSVALVLSSRRFGGDSVEVGAGWSSAFGLAMIAFAWLYPHFLDDQPAVIYLIGAPLGVVPCPTLSLVVGATILFRGIDGRARSFVVAAAGIVYGVVGVVVLGVGLDLMLIAGSVALLAVVLRGSPGNVAEPHGSREAHAP